MAGDFTFFTFAMTQPTNQNSFTHDLWHHYRRLNFRCFRPAKFAGLQEKRWAFDQHRCIFVHIPKCAGISVVKSLFGDFDCGHTNLRRYQIMFAPAEFKSYFKFTFVRNPFDRLVSAFLFLKQGGVNEKDKRWAEKNLSQYDTFDAFARAGLHRRNIRRALHFRPQAEFICVRPNRPGLDFIGYYENLPADFAFISRQLGIHATLAEANRNASREKDYRQYYTEESRKMVADFYAADLRILGYDFDNSDLPARLAARGADGRASR
jgi:hypothetical protein